MPKVSAFILMTALAMSASACRRPPAAAEATTADGSKPAGPPKPVPAQLPAVVARVNGEDVKKADFDMLVRNMELQGQGPIPPDRRDEVLRGALDQLITYTVLRQETASRSIAVSEAEIETQIGAMRQKFPDEAAFKKALGERSMSLERLRDDARSGIAIGKLLNAEVPAQSVTDAEAQDFYQKNPAKFELGETVRASHILTLADQNADDATKKKARAQIDALHKRVKAGEDFAKLAREHSQDGSSAQGGDLNYFRRGAMVPQFDEVAFALKPGEVSDVVTTQFGFHIIKVTDRKPSSTIPLADVSHQVKQYLAEQKKQAFIAGLRKKARIEVLI